MPDRYILTHTGTNMYTCTTHVMLVHTYNKITVLIYHSALLPQQHACIYSTYMCTHYTCDIIRSLFQSTLSTMFLQKHACTTHVHAQWDHNFSSKIHSSSIECLITAVSCRQIYHTTDVCILMISLPKRMHPYTYIYTPKEERAVRSEWL